MQSPMAEEVQMLKCMQHQFPQLINSVSTVHSCCHSSGCYSILGTCKQNGLMWWAYQEAFFVADT